MGFSSSSSSTSSCLPLRAFLIIIVEVLFCYHGGTIAEPLKESVPAVFVFGDSIVDPGNNNNLKTIVKSNFPPYGRDYIGGIPTRVPSDMMAEKFKVKKILPAYLDPNLQMQDFLSGVSFASGGSGYDPLTPQIVSVLSLSDQLKMFKDYNNKIKAPVGETKSEMIISKSIYIVCIGSDDIANTYFSTPVRKCHYDIPAYTDLMAKSASSFFQELYGEGARRIGVLSLPPIGCVPSQRTLNGGVDRGCSEQAEQANQAAKLFNSKLGSLINSLNQRFPEARFVYLDIYNPLQSLIQNPTNYGFEVGTKGCCGTGNIEVSILCNRHSINTCSNATKYIFWDSYHPSEKAYEILSHIVLDNKINNFF